MPMKSIMAILFLLCGSSSAYAEWVQLTNGIRDNDTKANSLFINYATATKEADYRPVLDKWFGENVTVWSVWTKSLYRYTQWIPNNGGGYASQTVLYKIHCENKIFWSTALQRTDRDGKQIYSDTRKTSAQPIQPDSIAQTIYLKLCK